MHFRSRVKAARRLQFRQLISESLESRNLFATIATFDHTPTPYIQSGPDNLQFTSLFSGGATGEYMKFMIGNKAGLSALSFDQTDDFAADTVVAEFMFRDTYVDRRFDSFDFALLNTADYGAVGTRQDADHDAGFANSLSFRFVMDKDIDIPHELWSNSSLQVIFNGEVAQEISLKDTLDLHSGQWHRARFVVNAAAGTVSIDLTPEGRNPIRVAEDLAIPGLTPYEMRAHFSNDSTNTAAGNIDLDSIAVNYLRAGESYVTFDDWRLAAQENGEPISVKLRRFGDLSAAADVRVKTASGSAKADADFESLDEVVTFAPGQDAQSVDLVMIDDFNAEDNNYFWLRTISTSANVKAPDPMSSLIRIYDDETGRETGQALPLFGLARVPIHTVMFPNGKVMFWGRQHESGAQIYDPATGETTDVPVICTHTLAGEEECHEEEEDHEHFNIFCSGHTLLPDGRLFVAGGHEKDFIGLKTAFIYDSETNRWTRLPDMAERRWYPTVLPLPNGDVLVLHGTIEADGDYNEQPEVWEHETNTWRKIDVSQDTADNHEAHLSNFYPRAFVAPDGRIFYFGLTSWWLDIRPGVTDPWQKGPSLVTQAKPDSYGTVTEYAPGKLLVVGGRRFGTRDAEVIDLNQPNPQFRAVGQMTYARRQQNATILPDGRVLITGGHEGEEHAGPANAQLPTEIWDPVTEKFTVQSSLAVERLYHSTGLLLPDGSVWTGGTGEPNTVPNARDQRNAQIFQPSYMFYANRPEITLAPKKAALGQEIYVTVNRPLEVASVSLIRLGSVTHSLEMSANYIPVEFEQAAGGLDISIPGSATTVIPGYYYLSVVDYRGVPSESKIIQILPSGEANFLSIADAQVTEAAGATANFQVRLSEAQATDTVISYRTLTSSAKPGTDFTAAEDTITIAAGQLTGVISISIVNDAVREANEWFSVDIFDATGDIAVNKRRAQGIIRDNDGETSPTVSIGADTSAQEGNNIVLNVTLSAPSAAATFVPYQVEFGSANKSDLAPKAGSISIPAGQTKGQITIATKTDNMFEADEYFIVNLVNVPGIALGDREAWAWIVNNDPLPTMTPENLTIMEGTGGATTAYVVVRLSNPVQDGASVNYTTKSSSARAGSDFLSATGTLYFQPGETVKTIPITILSDSTKEGTEEFFVAFSSATKAKLITTQIRVRLQNDD